MPILVAIVALLVFFAWKREKASGATSTPTSNPYGLGASSNPIDDMGEAIARFEGFYQSGSVAARDNNPGNLKQRGGAGWVGSTGAGFAEYQDVGDGWTSLNDYLTRHIQAHPDWDFYDFFSYYLRGKTNGATQDNQGNSDAYAEYVASYMGADPTQTVSSAIYGG